MKGNLYVMVGVPGSGKSTVAKSVAAQKEGTVIVSSDALRKKYFGDESKLYDKAFLEPYFEAAEIPEELRNDEKYLIKAGHAFIFVTADEMVATYLMMGRDVIYDATNLRRFARTEILKKFNRFRDKAYIVYVDCPLELALQRNVARSRVVPEPVVRAMYANLEVPVPHEAAKRGWVPRSEDWTDVITVSMR